MSKFKFEIGQSVRIKEGSFPMYNPDGYGLIGQSGIVERSWNPRHGTDEAHIARSEDIQYFELLQYEVRIDGSLYSLNEDWLEHD
jgi:hypothetical protein